MVFRCARQDESAGAGTGVAPGHGDGGEDGGDGVPQVEAIAAGPKQGWHRENKTRVWQSGRSQFGQWVELSKRGRRGGHSPIPELDGVVL